MSEETALQTRTQGARDVTTNPDAFATLQRVANAYAGSKLVPAHFQNKPADVIVAMLMARRLGEDPFTMMQHLYVVHGRAALSAQYVIAKANTSGVFDGPLDWRETGTMGRDDYTVTAYATLAGGREVEFCVPMSMAKAEGWTKNPKYRSMPNLMLRYRSAVLLVRLYCPEVLLGASTVEESTDIKYADATNDRPQTVEVEVEGATVVGAAGAKARLASLAAPEPIDESPEPTEDKPW